MSKETLLSIIRAVLTIAGSYILGHNLFGPVIDQDALTQIGGAAMALVGAVWGFFDKTSTIEGVQSAVRSLVQIVGGFMVAAGKLSGQSLNSILGLIAAIAPVIQSYTSRVKVKQIDTGKLVTNSAGKVESAKPRI